MALKAEVIGFVAVFKNTNPYTFQNDRSLSNLSCANMVLVLCGDGNFCSSNLNPTSSVSHCPRYPLTLACLHLFLSLSFPSSPLLACLSLFFCWACSSFFFSFDQSCVGPPPLLLCMASLNKFLCIFVFFPLRAFVIKGTKVIHNFRVLQMYLF